MVCFKSKKVISLKISNMSISVSKVVKSYGLQKAVNEVSFDIKAGEIVGFLGPNGAGKSTMMRLITGYLTPSAGVVKVNNMDVSLYGKEVRRNIGYLPEHNPLYLDMYVKEYLTMVGGIYQLPKVAASVAKMVELTGLGNEQHKKIEALSKGYRQRVGLAQALIHNPSVLILDEPTTGLDPNQIIEVRNLIKTIGREKTVLLSTHIMQEVEAVCERVLIINNGVLVTDQKSDNLAFSKVNTELVVDVEFNNSININLLNQLEGVIKTENVANNQYRIFSTTNQDIRPELFHLAVKENLVILSLSQQKQGLEDLFHQLTQ